MQITPTHREPYNLKMKDIDPGGFLPQILDTNFTKFQTYKFYQLFIPCIRTPFPPSLASMLSKKSQNKKCKEWNILYEFVVLRFIGHCEMMAYDTAWLIFAQHSLTNFTCPSPRGINNCPVTDCGPRFTIGEPVRDIILGEDNSYVRLFLS